MKKTECQLSFQTAVILFALFAFKSVSVSTYRNGIATYARQKFLTTIWLKILRRITNYSASSPSLMPNQAKTKVTSTREHWPKLLGVPATLTGQSLTSAKHATWQSVSIVCMINTMAICSRTSTIWVRTLPNSISKVCEVECIWPLEDDDEHSSTQQRQPGLAWTVSRRIE